MKICDIVVEDDSDEYMFSGLYHSNDNADILYKPPTTKPRKPKETLLAVHNYVNVMSFKKFGVPIRNSMFGLNYKDTGFGDYCYDVMVIPNSTRIFFNPNVNDFTVDLKAYLHTFITNLLTKLSDIISNDDIMELQPLFKQAMKRVNPTFKSLGESLKSVVYKVNSSIYEEVSDVIDGYILSYKERLDEYVRNTEEVDVNTMANSNEPADSIEFMIYSTKNINLRRSKDKK